MAISKHIRVALSLLLFMAAGRSLVMGQELIWEKKIPLSTYEYFKCVAKCSDGGYLAFGTSERWLRLNPEGRGAILMRFDENGDTLWTKWTGKYGGFNKVIKGEDGLLYALMGYRDTITSQAVWCIYVVTEDGIHITDIPLNPGPDAVLVDLEYRLGCFWLSGEKMPSLFFPSGLSFDFLLMKVRTDGSEVFSYHYNGGDQTSRGNKMEFMPNGNILFSGSVGNKIGAFEIDTAGEQIQYRTYLTNNFNMGWQEPLVNQMADGNRLVGAYRSTSPKSFYLGKHDTSSVRIWGGYTRGALTATSTHTDSSTVFAISNHTDGDQLVKIRPDSTIVWEVNFSQTPLGGFKGIDDLWYESDGSVVMAGYFKSTSNGAQNLYIAKVSGFGIPFDPTSAKALESLKTDAVPLAFPNPGTDVVKFTILAGTGKVSFTDMQGRKVYEGEYVPEKGISTKSLPVGMYNYRLERNGKVWSGKWVKQ